METQEIILEHKEDEAGYAAGSTDLEGPVVPALRKLTISGNLLPTMSSRTMKGAALQSFLPTINEVRRERRQGECVKGRRRGSDGFAGESGYTVADSGGHVTGNENLAEGDGLAGTGKVVESGGNGNALYR